MLNNSFETTTTEIRFLILMLLLVNLMGILFLLFTPVN